MLQFFTKKRGQKGFTLIELLVVIAVIGMLASIVLVSLGPVRKKARDARRQSDIRQINLAMEMCYPDSACGGLERYLATTAGANTVTAIGTYMPSVPKDPLTPTQDYTWTANASPYQYYCVYVKLEAEDDTWFCASNAGVLKKTATAFGCEADNTAPCNDDCCGVDLTP